MQFFFFFSYKQLHNINFFSILDVANRFLGTGGLSFVLVDSGNAGGFESCIPIV